MSRISDEFEGFKNVVIEDARSRVFKILYPEAKQPDNNEYVIPQTLEKDKVLYPSLLGTPVYADVLFKGRTYEDKKKGLISFEDIALENCIVEIEQKKQIVTTLVQGRDGSIKEYISLKDYTVKITGIISGSNGTYPIDKVTILKEMLSAPVSIEVSSWYLQLWDIDNVVVSEFNLKQIAGGHSQQTYIITALSDDSVSIILI